MSIRRGFGASSILLVLETAVALSGAASDGGRGVPVVAPVGGAVVIDGVLEEGEWTDAISISTDVAFELYLKRSGDLLLLGIKTPERSVANVLIALGGEVRILHSSAALGTATYRQDGDAWRLEKDFVWKCRGLEASPATLAERERFLAGEGWLASTALMGTPGEIEYEIAWPDGRVTMAVLVAPVRNPGAVMAWPSGASQTALPGPIPSQAEFDVASWPTVSRGDLQRLAFSSVRDGNSDIYTMSVDGSDLHRVTTAVAGELEPSWSPDRTRLAYQSRRPAWSLYTSLLDGSDERALGTSLSWSPSWSPDGSRIAYSTGSSICAVSVADGSIETLVPSCGDCGRPAWSPDGTRLAFHASRGGSLDIYVLETGGELRQLTTDRARDLHASWSPDGGRLVFASERSGDSEIYTMGSDGTNVTRITESAGDDFLPAWSPDGEWIAFTSHRDGDYEIYRMRPDGSDVVRLTENPGDDMYPAWEP